MPAAIGAAILTEIGATTLAASTVAATVVGYAATTGALLAAQLVLNELAPAERRADAQLTVRQAIPPRVRGHGRDKLGGAIFFLDLYNGNILRGVVHHDGKIIIREYWIGDIKTALTGQTGGLVPDAVYQGKLAIEAHAGEPDQAASFALSQFPYWSTDARLRGLAYTVVSGTPLKHGSLIFPEGCPDVRLVADLSPCFDPRLSGQSTANPATWTPGADNAGLALLEWLTHESGGAYPWEEINLDSFAAFANLCDQLVPLLPRAGSGIAAPDHVPEGATEKRYRYWGTYTFLEPRARVLARFLDACDAELTTDGDGRLVVCGGQWEAPTVTITQDMVLGWDTFEAGNEAYATANQVKFSYKSPLHDYQPVEGDPWNDDAAQAAEGTIRTEADFSRVPSHRQARALAKIRLAKLAPRYRFTGLRLKPHGLIAYGETTVRVVLPMFDQPGKPFDHTFRISRCVLTGEMLTTPVLDLYALDAGAYAWTPTEEGNPPPLPDVDVPAPPPIPSGLTVEIVRTVVAGSVTGLSAGFSAAAVPSQPDLVLVGRYRRVGDTGWRDMQRSGGRPVAAPLDDGAAYEGQCAWLSSTGISDYSASLPFSAAADTLSPGPPVSVVATGGSGKATIAFNAPNAANFGAARIHRGAGGATLDAATPGPIVNGAANQGFEVELTLAPGSYRLWVRALNRSGYPSALSDLSSTAGPYDVTVS